MDSNANDQASEDLTFLAAPSTLEKIDYIYTQLKELEPLLADVKRRLPDFIEQVEPIIGGLKSSPVLKMMGVRL